MLSVHRSLSKLESGASIPPINRQQHPMASYRIPPTAPTAMTKRLDIGRENHLMPFLREAVDIMCSDPQKYGLCGHRINQLLPSQTLNSFDLSLLVLDPVAPIPPAEPSLETIRAELPPTIASPSLPKEPAKETSKDTSKKAAKASAEGKEEEPTSTSTTVSSFILTPAVDAESLLKRAQEKHRIEMEMWKISYRRYCEDLEDARKHDMAALALLMANEHDSVFQDTPDHFLPRRLRHCNEQQIRSQDGQAPTNLSQAHRH